MKNGTPPTPDAGREAHYAGAVAHIVPNDARAAAHLYLQKGWRVVPVPRGAKRPTLSGWQNLRLTEDELELYFSPDSNVGILLGSASGGLVDVDLDTPQARAVAAELLPPTPMVHGRLSAPRSHYWYACPTLGESRIQYADPEQGLLLEIRADGHQSNTPPSTHPSGEVLEWQGSALEPAQVDAETLKRACARVAAAAALVVRWRDGIRNDLSLALSGYLARCGWAEQEALDFLKAVCAAAHDDEWRNRLDACRRTFQRVAAGEPATGLPSVAELLGERVAQQLGEWLGGGRVNFGHSDILIYAPNVRNSDEEEEEPVAIDLASIEPKPQAWLVERLIPARHTTNLYADSESGKSLLALRLALSVVSGRPFLGYAVHKRGRVLYADFELNPEVHAARWYAVAAGMGYERPPAGLFYYRFHADLFSSMRDLQRLINRHQPDLLIIDSLGFALVDPLKPDRAIAAYRIFDSLPLATLVVDHTPKPTADTPAEEAREYGSSYKRHYARSALQLVVQGRECGEVGLVLRQVKSSFGERVAEIPVRMRIEAEDGMLLKVEYITGAEAFSSSELFGHRGEVVSYLQEHGQATAPTIATALGIPERTVRRLLATLTQQGIVQANDARPRVYSLADSFGQTARIYSAPNVRNADPDFEQLLQQLQADDLFPITADEAECLRCLWQAAAAHDFPRLQLPSLLITPGRTAWLEGVRLLAGTAEVSLALSLLQQTNGHGFIATPSDGDAVQHTPTGDLQSGLTAPAQAN